MRNGRVKMAAARSVQYVVIEAETAYVLDATLDGQAGAVGIFRRRALRRSRWIDRYWEHTCS